MGFDWIPVEPKWFTLKTAIEHSRNKRVGRRPGAPEDEACENRRRQVIWVGSLSSPLRLIPIMKRTIYYLSSGLVLASAAFSQAPSVAIVAAASASITDCRYTDVQS